MKYVVQTQALYQRHLWLGDYMRLHPIGEVFFQVIFAALIQVVHKINPKYHLSTE